MESSPRLPSKPDWSPVGTHPPRHGWLWGEQAPTCGTQGDEGLCVFLHQLHLVVGQREVMQDVSQEIVCYD